MLRCVGALTAIVIPCVAATAAPLSPPALDSTGRSIEGTYSDGQLAGVGTFTLPRTFLYDRTGELIPHEQWPTELAEVRRHAGEAFCCVSKTPAKPGGSGPPPDCEIVVYGTDVQESFEGLLDASGRGIAYEALPEHQYLLVEYYASWCQPCVAGRRALEAFFATSAAEHYLWLSIDMSRLPEAQAAAESDG